ncbi:hypothetical protein LCGC14_2982280 [marine sediment metagenome]|uniref:Uncharacterized protein n=1 Tax=marine sediment metagenome TaxID=412755 RepID=A0A0F8X678_9ZZZZ
MLTQVIKSDCGCEFEISSTGQLFRWCPLHKSARDMYEALNKLPERIDMLAEAAYTGGDIPKTWIRDRGNYADGYNKALEDVQKLREKALAKAEGK